MRNKNVRLSTVILRRLLFLLLLGLCTSVTALMLTGCGSLTKRSQEKAPIPASLMQPCPDLTSVSGVTGEVMFNKLMEFAFLYHDCKDGKQKLIDAVK